MKDRTAVVDRAIEVAEGRISKALGLSPDTSAKLPLPVAPRGNPSCRIFDHRPNMFLCNRGDLRNDEFEDTMRD